MFSVVYRSNARGLVVLVGLAAVSAFDSEVISDIVAPIADERRSLEIKSNQFWQAIEQVTKHRTAVEHLAVYAEVTAAIEATPVGNDHVRGQLTDALRLLQAADEQVFAQAHQSSELASEKLASGPPAQGMFSFFSGGQSFFSLMIKRFVNGGEYAERLSQHVTDRQADVLPALHGAKSVSGDVLRNCRLASELSFHVLKYDIYQATVSKTPELAKAAAKRLIEAVMQTRQSFRRGIVGMASAIAKDTREKNDDPSAKVTQTLREDLKPFGSVTQGRHNGFNVARENRFVFKDIPVLKF